MKAFFQHLYNVLADICAMMVSDLKAAVRDEGVLIFVVLVPLLYPLLYSWIYDNEVVREVPVAVVDASHSSLGREFVRRCDAAPDVRVAAWCNNLDEARQLIGRQEVYGVLYLPEDFATRLNRMEQSTVSLFCNMGLMLTYKALYQTTNAVASDMNANLQVQLSGNYTDRENELTTRPLDFDEVPMFNNTGGYGNFILPGVLVLIIQQVLLLSIGMASGTAYERRRFSLLRPVYERRWGLLRVVGGKFLCYFMLFTALSAYVMLAVPRMFSFVQLLHARDFVLFLLPYLTACICFALTVSFLMRRREDVMLLVVFTSVPLLFMSGVSWPGSNIPELWRVVSCLFPSTFGIQGFIKMNTLGAVFADIVPEIRALWLQAACYLVTACLVVRWQIRTR